MDKKLFTSGEVAKMSGITIRTLRYYDSIELLVPIKDNRNGYRYYDKENINRLQLILGLKNMNFSLNDIKKYMFEDNINITTVLEYQKEDISKKIQLLKNASNKIDFILGHIDDSESLVTDIFAMYESIQLMNHNEIAKKFISKNFELSKTSGKSFSEDSHEKLNRFMICLFNDSNITIEDEVVLMKEILISFIETYFGKVTKTSIKRTVTFLVEMLKSNGDIEVNERSYKTVLDVMFKVLIEGENKNE